MSRFAYLIEMKTNVVNSSSVITRIQTYTLTEQTLKLLVGW